MFWRFLLKFVAPFDAESLHLFSVRVLRALSHARWLLRWLSGTPTPSSRRLASAPAVKIGTATTTNALPVQRQPKLFPQLNALGLAAGFDKNAEILHLLPDLGFGFAEIGTITPRAQAGNARPRLFRFYDEDKIFNRMGFNNLGAVEVRKNLESALRVLPADFGIGVNIGKNKDTADQDAARDYAEAARHFADLAHFFVINVSSPNTPGLRALQKLESLLPILAAVKGVSRTVPVLIKLAPEIGTKNGADELAQTVSALGQNGADGFVLGNTLGGEHQGQTGGWSGAMLEELARTNLATARAATKLPLISVGGILSPDEAARRLSLGAQAVEIYTGWIMRGPRFPARVARRLAGFTPPL